jgi:hypothetical protein
VSLFGPPSPQRPASSNLFPLAPIPLTGADFSVQLAGFVFAPRQILLDNESPYLLQLTIGGGRFFLRPWVSNVFPTGGSAEMQVHPIVLTTPLPLAPSATLLVTLVPGGEEVPGIYPMEATRAANAGIAQGVRINITTPIVAAAAGGATQIVVADARNFVIADPVFIDRQASGLGGTFAGFIINAIVLNGDGTWTLTLASGLPAGGVQPGDVIVLAPTVQVSFNDTVTVAPAPGQAPTGLASSESFTGLTTYTLRAGVAGQTLRVFGWNLSVETGGASGFARIRDSGLVAGAPNSTIAATRSELTAQSISGNHGGVPLTPGGGLAVDTANPATIVRVSVGCSQV